MGAAGYHALAGRRADRRGARLDPGQVTHLLDRYGETPVEAIDAAGPEAPGRAVGGPHLPARRGRLGRHHGGAEPRRRLRRVRLDLAP